MLGTLYTLSHLKSTTNLWDGCIIILILQGKILRCDTHGIYPAQVGFELESVSLWSLSYFSILYIQICHIASTTSQRCFNSIKPLNLYWRLCLYHFIYQSFSCFKRKETNLNLNLKIWATIINQMLIKVLKMYVELAGEAVDSWYLYFHDFH